jgi:hypothetical protein
MEVLFRMHPEDWIIFWMALFAHGPLIVGLVKEKDDQSQTFFTWFIYFVLDIITMISSAEVDGSYVILFGFSSGSLIMAAILLFQRRVVWTWHETWVGLLIIVCLVAWYFSGPYWAMISGIFSELIIGIYLIVRTFKYPRRKYNLPGYIIFLIVSILTIFFAKNDSIEQIGYGSVEAILCAVIIFPLLRKK